MTISSIDGLDSITRIGGMLITGRNNIPDNVKEQLELFRK